MSHQEDKQTKLDRFKHLGIVLYIKSSIAKWRYRRQAYQALMDRYKAVFQFWWSHRDQMKIPDLTPDEAHFLPAALALQASPTSPAGRWVARILLSLIVVLLLWSIFGKIDIIVNGQGKIIAGGYTKTIASVEVAKVLALHVEEGQTVKAGDVLLELDARSPDSEQNKADGDRQLALLQMERSKALLQSLASNKEPKLAPINGIDDVHYQNETHHLFNQWQDYLAKRTRIISQIKRFGDALPMVTRRAEDYAALAKDHDVSAHAYFEKEQARIELQGQLDDAKTQLVGLTAETGKTAQDELYQATRIWSGAVQDVNKAAAHSEQLHIVSPVDGVVQQLTVHTIGGVVSAAQPLMLIVPNGHAIELEAYVENKDIGFMQEGEKAQVKIDAYEYTKYGTVSALVTHVSRDAVDFSGNGTGQLTSKDADAKNVGSSGAKGLMYAIKVTLQESDIWVDGKKMPLLPGMSGSVEIKTGERRIIEYVLSPLMTHLHESMHER